jgi:hypothetical protein
VIETYILHKLIFLGKIYAIGFTVSPNLIRAKCSYNSYLDGGEWFHHVPSVLPRYVFGKWAPVCAVWIKEKYLTVPRIEPRFSRPKSRHRHHRTSSQVVFNFWNQAFRIVRFLLCSPNVSSIMKGAVSIWGTRTPEGTRKYLTGCVKLNYLIHYSGCNLLDYRPCITWIIHQQIWGYKVEEKFNLGVREQKGTEYHWCKEHHLTISRGPSCFMSRLYGRDTIVYTSEHYVQ